MCRGLGIEELLPDIQAWFAPIVSNDAPAKNQRTMLQLAGQVLEQQAGRLLLYNSDWLTWHSGAYRGLEDQTIRTAVYREFPSAGKAFVSNVADALRSLTHIDRNNFTPPCWLDRRAAPKSENLLVLRNGLLDLDSGQLLPIDAAFFTFNALDFDYQPDASPPERWLKFLEEVWPDEVDCRETLQLIFGYNLTPDTSHHVIPVLCGPTRCGKGTISRTQRKLLGEHNVTSPTLRSLGEDFGKQSMIGKQLAQINDMRMGAKTDKAAVTETLLTISGEDAVSIPRKNKTDWEGRLRIKFFIAQTSRQPSTIPLARCSHVILCCRCDRLLSDAKTATLTQKSKANCPAFSIGQSRAGTSFARRAASPSRKARVR